MLGRHPKYIHVKTAGTHVVLGGILFPASKLWAPVTRHLTGECVVPQEQPTQWEAGSLHQRGAADDRKVAKRATPHRAIRASTGSPPRD